MTDLPVRVLKDRLNECWDTAQTAHQEVKRSGVVVDTRHGKKANPALSVHRDAVRECRKLAGAIRDLEGR